MKKLMFYFLLFASVSCTPKPETSSKEAVSVPTVQNTPSADRMATEDLALYLDMQNGPPALMQIFDSIKAEYPKLLADIAFLKSDSMKGIQIDCMGVTHFESRKEDNWKTTVSEEAKASQQFVKQRVEEGGYDVVSGDFSAHFGPVDLGIAVDEQLRNTTSLSQIMGFQHRPTYQETKDFLRDLATKDYTCSLACANSKKPYVIGTEPRWVYLAQQYLISTVQAPPGQYPEIDHLIMLFSRVRSEISYSRMAQYLLKTAPGKKGVLLYGQFHNRDYMEFQQRFGTKGIISIM